MSEVVAEVGEHEMGVDEIALFPEYDVKKAVDRHSDLGEVLVEEVEVHFGSRVKVVAQ